MNEKNTLTDFYSRYSENQRKTTEAVVKFVKNCYPYLILLLNVAVLIGSKLFKTWVENPFTPEFFISLATNLLTTMFCYSCFINYGEKNELMNEALKEDWKKWETLSTEVRSHRNEEFSQYCKDQVEIERVERRNAIISNNTMISPSVYEDKYRNLNTKQIKALKKKGEITKSESFYIIKANDAHKVKPINPMLILSGVKMHHANDVGRDNYSYSTLSILGKPVVTFLITAAVTMFKGSWIGIGDASAIFDMLYSSILVVISSIMGYSSGANSAHKEHERIKGRIYFLERFLNNVKA